MKHLIFLLLLVGCDAPPEAGHVHESERLPVLRLVGEQVLRPGGPFRQVGLMIDGPAEGLRYQVRWVSGALSPVAPVPLTWTEGMAHVGRILLPEPAAELVLVSAQAVEIHPEFWSVPQTDPVRPLARALPYDEGLGTLRQALAPRELVIPREEWGARNPGLVCNQPENVYRISVHHTAAPADDGGDPAARMRQIQAYHIDNNGWCDIGYHFVVSQSGLIFEARRDERAPAAHVANQNSGNVGICFIGNYEQAQVPDAQFAAGARIMGWVRMTHGVPASRDVIRGHQQWPGQQTACPGRNLLARLDELIALSDGQVEPPPPPPPERVAVEYRTAWAMPENPHTQGTSVDVPDAMPGQRLQVALVIRNGSPGPLRGVRLGYAFGEGLNPIDYVIQTDWPAKDQQTWLTNDADAAPENPPKAGLGAAGELVMYAFGSGETKRVLVTLEVGPYRGTFRPQARGFVRHIDDVYDQGDFEAEPGLNTTETRLAQAVGLDVISRTEWAFPSAEVDDLEGFSTCGADLANEAGTLVLPADGCALSPPWTAVDADRWDSMAVALSQAPAAGRLAVWWPGADGSFEHALTFDIAGPGTWILPLDVSPDWAGIVPRLRLTIDGALALDHVFPWSRAREESGSLVPVGDVRLANVLTDEDPPPAATGAGLPPPRDADVPAPDAPDAGDAPTAAEGEGEAGCTQKGGRPPLLLCLLVLVTLRIYRRS